MATGTRLRLRWGERSYSLLRNLQSAFRSRPLFNIPDPQFCGSCRVKPRLETSLTTLWIRMSHP